jgi:hypothetical protein
MQGRRAKSPNDPKLSDCGATARCLHGGGKAAAEAGSVTARSSSLQRMVRRIGPFGLFALSPVWVPLLLIWLAGFGLWVVCRDLVACCSGGSYAK